MSTSSVNPCCEMKEWIDVWKKQENAFKSPYSKHVSSSIGFDLWCIAHGLRDCLLIDHVVWRQRKMHEKLFAIIANISKKHHCGNHMDYFYFNEQLFIVHLVRFKQRLHLDIQGRFSHYVFVDVSAKVEIPIICNSKQLSDIRTSLKQMNVLLLDLMSAKKSDHRMNNHKNTTKRTSTKRKRKKLPSSNKHVIHEKDILDLAPTSLYPTICGYLLNYLFVYYTDDVQRNCLNQQQLVLFTFKLQNKGVIQFSAPDCILQSMPSERIKKYMDRLNGVPLVMSSQCLTTNSVTL